MIFPRKENICVKKNTFCKYYSFWNIVETNKNRPAGRLRYTKMS